MGSSAEGSLKQIKLDPRLLFTIGITTRRSFATSQSGGGYDSTVKNFIINTNTKLICQSFPVNSKWHMMQVHSTREQAIAYGTKMVGSISLKKAVEVAKPETNVIYTPPAVASLGPIENGILLVVAIMEDIPHPGMVRVTQPFMTQDQVPDRIIAPEQCKIDIMPDHIHKHSKVGIVSRLGTLTYEAVNQTTEVGLGQTLCVGIGCEPLNGTNSIDCLKIFLEDSNTEGVVMIGEICGTVEEAAAELLKSYNLTRDVPKPLVSFIAGSTAPPGRRMGHAGAIISGEAGKGSTQGKIAALERPGAIVTPSRAKLGPSLEEVL
ncbi:succinyl-CoA synthetase-like protein [Dichotomocladium elegans]|nr:succinyl-CoA synthetase-like protein [Dichotomocladium elegans]